MIAMTSSDAVPALPGWILPALLAIPLAAATLVLVAGREEAPDAAPAGWRAPRVIAAAALALEAALATGLWLAFDPSREGWQAAVDAPWIEAWGARLRFGVDGTSALMILLTTWVMLLGLVGSWTAVRTRLRSYCALLLAFTAGCVGLFASLDLLLFYVMWEAVLVPLYLMIGVWGGAGRGAAGLRFFVLTMGASLLMLVAIGVTWAQAGAGSFALDALLAAVPPAAGTQVALFTAFLLAFAVKSAMWPFHAWLPDAQHEAPTTAAIALGIKVGAYGLFRFAMPLFPAAVADGTVRGLVVGAAVTGILYGALVAMVQPDLKRLVSYAAVSHAGFVLLGLFTTSVEGAQGAVFVMLSSGVVNAVLFLLLGMLHERRGTWTIDAFGGLARVMPRFAVALAVAALAAIGLPGTIGFTGEFLVLLGAFRAAPFAATAATVGVVLAAVYMLWAVQRVLFQPLAHEENRGLRDLDLRERFVMAACLVVIVGVGIAPSGVLRRVEPSARRFAALAAGARGTGSVASGAPAPRAGVAP